MDVDVFFRDFALNIWATDQVAGALVSSDGDMCFATHHLTTGIPQLLAAGRALADSIVRAAEAIPAFTCYGSATLKPNTRYFTHVSLDAKHQAFRRRYRARLDDSGSDTGGRYRFQLRRRRRRRESALHRFQHAWLPQIRNVAQPERGTQAPDTIRCKWTTEAAPA